ncbi:MAG: hypothetical protein ABJP34_03660 [Erythrobacter sp.]
MKTAMIAVAATLLTSTAAFAQDNDGADIDVTNTNVEVTDVDVTETTDVDVTDKTVVKDSLNDNSDRDFQDSFDDNRDYNSHNDNSADTITDSFDDLSDNYSASVTFANESVFDDSAIVAEATLSNVVTGVDVDYGNIEDTARLNNQLTNRGNAFQNYAGMNAMNQNTGAGAAQNASVTIAVSTDNLDVN